ncbi:conserved hypothetical protein [Gloeothece citriformis PCC 7424]|uniref:ATPase AAA-type core domain-containing protein n=1 Tax=Gloeothece citriformis (strain PCC 7424) TaxID=65393 RepID=B7KF55_GLOC7|nr:AAA family ATPase [Gloeothece citriformis]ACK70511.1 conserved hypothetical protein [Gloeothece citriformis PCC 7424]
MKLKRFFIEYRVLQDLEIYFGPSLKESKAFTDSPAYNLDFLVGVNGTGKSTVLRILFELLRLLERQAAINFPFELEYELEKVGLFKTIFISNRYQDLEKETIEYKQTPEVWEIDNNGNYNLIQLSSDILPDLVIAFTTGSESNWSTIDETNLDYITSPLPSLSPLDLAIGELPGKPLTPIDEEDDTSTTESKCIFISSSEIPLITLCGLLTDLVKPDKPLSKVREASKIKKLSGFSLKFRKPNSKTQDWEKVEELAKLTPKCLRIGTDYQLIFDLSDANLPHRLIETYYSGFELFKTLSQLAKPDKNGQTVLQSVNLFLERPMSDHPETDLDIPLLHLLDWLSDGEKSFLGRMCLLTLLETDEALILLDEPEVHFNDFWKRQIVYLLDTTLKKRHSHILISTHSSITLTDVPKENIMVLDRNGNYTNKSLKPSMNTFAADPSDIMVHVFGSPYPSGELSINRVEDELANKLKRSTEERKEALENLKDVVASGYWSFLIRQELQSLK